MKRALLAAALIFVSWMLVDTLAHRVMLEPLYAETPALWRPTSELQPALVLGVTAALDAIFVALYALFVRPRSLRAGLAVGTLLGLALGTASGLGTWLHSPIPFALAAGWFVLGTLKGVIAGALLGTLLSRD